MQAAAAARSRVDTFKGLCVSVSGGGGQKKVSCNRDGRDMYT